MRNQSTQAAEINLDNGRAVVAEIETLGPATTAGMTATFGSGSYTIKCYLAGQPVMSSAPVQVSGAAQGSAPVALKPVTEAGLTGPSRAYQAYAAARLADLAREVGQIQSDLRRGDLKAARDGWLAAQMDWERVGASYNSFGDAGVAVNGLPDGLPDGVHDKDFTGLHRLEYGLWHDQRAAQLRPVADRLARDITAVRRNLRSDDIAGGRPTCRCACTKSSKTRCVTTCPGSRPGRGGGVPGDTTPTCRRPGRCWARCPR